FVFARRTAAGQILVTKNKEKHGLVVAHGESEYLSSRNPVAEVDEFVPRTIALNLERGGVITEWHLDPRTRPAHTPPDARMRPIGANRQTGLTRGSMIEAHPHAPPLLLDARDRVAEDRLDRSAQRAVERRRKVGTPEAREATVEQAADSVCRDAAARAAAPV